ncbi:unnamed protein product, partial [Polarella glacialis]
ASFCSSPPRRPPVPERSASTGACSRRTADGGAGPSRSSGAGRSPGGAAPANSAAPTRSAAGPSSVCASPPPPAADALSQASDWNLHGHSVASLGGEDSSYGEERSVPATGDVADDVHGLRQTVESQQQRIQFLENMHQQALRQLRKSREELAQAQQLRFREADKVLGLEQLISEMQVQRFSLNGQMQLRWEEWLQRARGILEGD